MHAGGGPVGAPPARGELLDQKLAAILHQTSQVEATVDALGESFLREGLAEESFRAAD